MSAPSCHDGPAWPSTGAPLPVHLPPTTEKSISACRHDASVIATANVTSKATPVRNILASREGAGGEQKSQRQQSALSAFS